MRIIPLAIAAAALVVAAACQHSNDRSPPVSTTTTTSAVYDEPVDPLSSEGTNAYRGDVSPSEGHFLGGTRTVRSSRGTTTTTYIDGHFVRRTTSSERLDAGADR
jgi:hypothetical protein